MDWGFGMVCVVVWVGASVRVRVTVRVRVSVRAGHRIKARVGRLGGPIGDLWGAGATTPHRPSIGPPDFNELQRSKTEQIIASRIDPYTFLHCHLSSLPLYSPSPLLILRTICV